MSQNLIHVCEMLTQFRRYFTNLPDLKKLDHIPSSQYTLTRILQIFQIFYCILIYLFIKQTNLLVAELVEWSTLVSSCLHSLYSLTEALGCIVHKQIEEGDLSKTNVLLCERAEHVEDPYWPLLLPISNHRIK